MWPTGSKWASKGLHINTNFNSNERKLFANKNVIYKRVNLHKKTNKHIIALAEYSKLEKKTDDIDERNSSLEIDENDAIKIEPTDEIGNKIDNSSSSEITRRMMEYLENRVMKKRTWVEICDGKLFCKVNLTTADVKKINTFFCERNCSGCRYYVQNYTPNFTLFLVL